MNAVFLLVLFTVQATTGRNIFVSHGGLDHMRCGSKEDPCQSIGQAMAGSGAGDTILILQGLHFIEYYSFH